MDENKVANAQQQRNRNFDTVRNKYILCESGEAVNGE
jgi:hypothetical protein